MLRPIDAHTGESLGSLEARSPSWALSVFILGFAEQFIRVVGRIVLPFSSIRECHSSKQCSLHQFL